MKYFKEFELPKKPVISDYSVVITEFGAKEGANELCTDAVKKAMEHCLSHGGGRVIFPKGRWLCGAIHMRSNIELHFEEGCYVLFSKEKTDYLPVVYTSFEGIRCYNYSPLIYGYRLKNVAITGSGVLDGNGSEWWSWKINDDGINAIYTACMNNSPVEQRVYGEERYGLRPCFLQLVECEDILIEGITLKNSPFWTVHPVWCDRVTVRGLTLINPFKSPNTDSINIEACNTVLVEECNILGGGDDIYTLKSGRGPDGWEVGKPCKNVVIRNCRAMSTNGGGIVIGSEMSGGVENILARNCHFDKIMNGLKIKSKKGRGGYIKNIEYRDITAKNLSWGINVTLKYAYDDQFSGNDLEAMPDISNIHYENIVCENAANSVMIQGVEGCHIKNVSMTNVALQNCGTPIGVEYTDNIEMCNVSVIDKQKQPFD